MAAQIAYRQDNFNAASQSLDQALSLDFEVRDWPQYNLLKANVYTSQGDYDEALVVLEHALGLAKASKAGGDAYPPLTSSPCLTPLPGHPVSVPAPA